jgi:ribosomal protein S18 acetylase RimI-like enzyme
MQIIEQLWVAERCNIIDAATEDVASMNEIYEQINSYMVEVSGCEGRLPEQVFLNGNYPKGGNRSDSRLQCIKLRENGQIIGYIDFYQGYPTVDTLYIGFISICSLFRGKGYAREVIETLSRKAQNKGFKKIRVNVSLKNWSALRFWVKNGYTSVIRITGDTDYACEKFSNIELEINFETKGSGRPRGQDQGVRTKGSGPSC